MKLADYVRRPERPNLERKLTKIARTMAVLYGYDPDGDLPLADWRAMVADMLADAYHLLDSLPQSQAEGVFKTAADSHVFETAEAFRDETESALAAGWTD